MSKNTSTPPKSLLEELRAVGGYVIGFSYPLLGLSTLVRAIVQLSYKPGIAPWLSLVAGIVYLLATIGFFVRKPWTWRFSVAILTIELIGILIVGTLSIVNPQSVGATAWRHYGADYGWFPLIQPILGLFWLFWKPAKALYIPQG
ncbi:MAG TPA: hypothetical protein PK299_11945 [Anaerolineales bacterium]|nr:hypothetical protein [Anaerolineales bacterium]